MKTNENTAKKLQEILVQTVIDYCKEHKIDDIDVVEFVVDSINLSVPHSEWQPCTDSFIKIKTIEENEFTYC